ncbi:MAG: YciK family oxidoreductase [Porticoccaceae bacterium]|nr:YciK family oxidoreductase [Porticoccaceae bacterium]MDG1474720.1 YciK family oxidoreductase [Porticoccaceae bacterium]
MHSTQDIIRYVPPHQHLAERVIFITGAGSGIGRTAALACAQAGATVILAGRTVSKLESVYNEIISANHPEPHIVPIDFEGATTENYDELAKTIDEQFGRLDGLLLNAAILGQRTPLSHYTSSLWDKVLQVNLTSQVQLTQSLMYVLERSSDASIVFTTSGVGRIGRAFWGAYAVSKFAIEGLVQTWASEVEAIGSVRINAINPGATRTDMRAQAFPAENPEQLATAEDIMPAYLYLLGSDSNDMNGQSIEAQIRTS